MIPSLKKAGYEVTHVSGGLPSKDELAELNEAGIFYEGQKDIPGEATVRPVPETIVRVAGHGVDTTVYLHDEETIGQLARQETSAQLVAKAAVQHEAERQAAEEQASD